MKSRFGLTLILILITAVFCWAQTGTVIGVVTDDEGNPVEEARVMIRSIEGGCCGEFTFTGEDGSYTFEEVEVGTYIVHAMKRRVGRATSDEFEVLEGETVVINLQLEGCGGHGGGCHGGGCHGGGCHGGGGGG